ncbi:hypothetical protein HERIO_2736 [Hepatospora eriocheir]|uniref:Uncharacterized protein n=1 Tax=Hepatospora eriocheir TaxID=1081669 RepID=A0A1X0Q6Q9_9MICR|nr:hypothetical protein HERIO_2736 [Hepatospora eriocheir]
MLSFSLSCFLVKFLLKISALILQTSETKHSLLSTTLSCLFTPCLDIS